MQHKSFTILGPTASGKSSIVEQYYGKTKHSIINCDSKQVYQDIQILTDQPKHIYDNMLLYGFMPLTKDYSVVQWLKQVEEKISDLADDNTIFFVGGSTIYTDCLINGISKVPAVPKSIISKVNIEIQQLGNKNFWNFISELFPNQLDHIHYNNTYKLIQEVALLLHTGHNKKYWNNKNKRQKISILPKVEVLAIIPDNRNKLYDNINSRVHTMIDNGVIEEIELLLKKYDLQYISKTAITIHGLRYIIDYIKGNITKENMIDSIKMQTRQYAKRQITWLKNKIEASKVFPDAKSLKQYLSTKY